MKNFENLSNLDQPKFLKDLNKFYHLYKDLDEDVFVRLMLEIYLKA